MKTSDTPNIRLRDVMFCGSIATIFLLLSSTCSPLYAFNDWVDANSFLTMGKGILNGVVPYRDLFEQKGPLLYLIHSFAYLIDQTGFFGVFVFEVISMTLTLLIANKLVTLFVPKVYCYFILPLFAVLPLVSNCFESGDSAEEFCFPLIMGVLYLMAKHYKERPDSALTAKTALATGVLGGCVFLIKYTMLGYWIGFALVFAAGCLFRRQFLGLLKTVGLVLAGFALALVPWMIYFGLYNSIGDFINTYIIVNFKYYPADLTLIDRIRRIGLAIISNFGFNLVGGLISLTGVVVFAGKMFFSSWGGRMALPICGAIQIIVTYIGGNVLDYYYLAFFPLVIFGLIALAGLLKKTVQVKPPAWQLVGTIICYLLILTVATISFGRNIPLINQSRSGYPQYIFAKIINKVPDATLINYGFLDGGFYTAANITPRFKYFMLNNISYEKFPEMWTEHRRYIVDCEATFVVFRMDEDNEPENINFPGLHENYSLVCEATMPYRNNSGLVFRYALYQLNESIRDS